MMRFLLCLTCVFVLIKYISGGASGWTGSGLTRAADLKHAFNCRRPGTNSCKNSGSCPTAGGNCNCPNGFHLYDCSVAAPLGSCSCQGDDSVCSQSNTCVCDQLRYSGSKGTCEYETVQGICSEAGVLLMNVNIPNINNIDVFVTGKKSTCSFGTPASPMPADWAGKAKSIPISTNSADNCGATNGSPSDGHCTSIDIRHNSNYATSLDTRLKFCCKDGQATITLGNIDVQDIGVGAVQIQASPAAASMIDAKLKDNTGKVLAAGASKSIGDHVQLDFGLDSTADFGAIAVEKCQAQIGASDETTKEVFLDNTCLETATTWALSSTRTPDKKSVTIKTQAIRFDGQNAVYYKCILDLCRQASDCNLDTTCARPTTQTARKKRDVEYFIDTEESAVRAKRQASFGVNRTERAVVTTYITVRDPEAVVEVTQEKVSDCSAEDTRFNMTAAVVGLAVVVLVLMIVSALLGIVVINRRKTKTVEG